VLFVIIFIVIKSSFRFLSTMSSGGNFGEWEKYTNGIGSKLLAKMGFQPGQGLGKNAQGIVAPIEVNKRPGQGALGAYDFEEKATKKGLKEKEKAEQQKRKESTKDHGQPSSYKVRDKVKKIKVYEKSIDELILEGIQSGSKSTFGDDSGIRKMKIVDMTGPDQRILTGLSQLHQSKAQKPKEDYTPTEYNTRFDVPELKSNLERMLRITENKLTKCMQDNEKDNKNLEVYKDEINRLEKVITDDERKLKKFDQYDDFVRELEELDDDVTIESILERFENFKGDDNLETYGKLLRFDDLLMISLKGRLQKELRFWKPFMKDDRVFNIFQRLQKIVTSDKTFDLLLWNCWNTSVFRALQGWHSMKNFHEPIVFFEQWQPIIPSWLFNYQIKEVVIPKLLRELEGWNPLQDPIPVIAWIFPWNSVILENDLETDLGELFEPVYSIVRSKLGEALFYWQPAIEDRSVFSMIHPWKGKFADRKMQSFLGEKIAPKLEITFSAIPANESIEEDDNDNGLKAWKWAIEWRYLFDTKSLINLLERSFFPNWLGEIHKSLSEGEISYSSLEQHYRMWKKRLVNVRLVDEKNIQKYLFLALQMMHHRVDDKIGLKAYQFYLNTLQTDKSSRDKSSVKNTVKMSHLDAINFKQMVEQQANDNGILFMPINGRLQEGRQVYQFGDSLVYIDNQVIFRQETVKGQKLWSPIGLQELVEKSKFF